MRVTHGRPLPLELLDLAIEVPPEQTWSALVAATLARFSPETNPLLQPKDALIARGQPTPYASRAP